MKDNRIPSPFISLLPVFVLILLLFVTIRVFGSDALSGGSQVCLLTATAVCVLIGMAGYRRTWKDFELAITNNIAGVSTALIILLIIGALSGAWMISGVVPTFDLLWHSGDTSSLFSGVYLCDLCHCFSHDRQFVDNNSHYRHRIDGNRQGTRFQRGLDSGSDYFGCLFRR